MWTLKGLIETAHTCSTEIKPGVWVPARPLPNPFWSGSQQGSKHYAHKITESDVREIRRRIAEGGVTKTALAVEYGVCRQNIERIVHRKSWRHV